MSLQGVTCLCHPAVASVVVAGDTRSKYLSQGLLRMFGPDFIKRPDVSEWLKKEILADFKQFVTDKYSV
jgi:hypothetical protein